MKRFIFFIAIGLIFLTIYASADLSINGLNNTNSVINLLPPSSPGGNSTFNQTFSDQHYWRLDGTNAPPTKGWKMGGQSITQVNGLSLYGLSQLNWTNTDVFMTADLTGNGDLWRVRGWDSLDLLSNTGDAFISRVEGFIGHGIWIHDTAGVSILDNLSVMGQAVCLANGTNCQANGGSMNYTNLALTNMSNNFTGVQDNFTQIRVFGNATIHNVVADNVSIGGNINLTKLSLTSAPRLYVEGDDINNPVVQVLLHGATNGNVFQFTDDSGTLGFSTHIISFSTGAQIGQPVSSLTISPFGTDGWLMDTKAGGQLFQAYTFSQNVNQKNNTIKGADAVGTNHNGGNLVIEAGNSTGNGFSSIILSTIAPNQGTGTTNRGATPTFFVNANMSILYSNLTFQGSRSYFGINGTMLAIYNSTGSMIVGVNDTNGASHNVYIPALAQATTAYVCVNSDGRLYSEATGCGISP